jgi:PadR family transcriptional regulator, regulatory protein PadR
VRDRNVMKKNYLSYTMALTLQAIENGYGYGFDIMAITGLASGTVYPALRRLESSEFVVSNWEKQSIAQAEQRPPRKYYEVTKLGRSVLAEARQRFRLLSQLEPLVTNKPAREKG